MSEQELYMAACAPGGEVLIAGVGSPHGNDSAGWRVVKAIQLLSDQQPWETAPPRLQCRTAAVPHDLLDWMLADLPTHIVDAVLASSDKPGRYAISNQHGALQILQHPQHLTDSGSSMQLDRSPLLQALRSRSTHQLDLLSVLQLACQLDRLPKYLTLWTIPIEAPSKPFDGVTLQTQHNIEVCARQIWQVLRHA